MGVVGMANSKAATCVEPAQGVLYSLEDSFAYQLRITYKYYVQALQPLLEKHDITMGMWYYLRVLWDEDGLTQREISERVGLVAPTTVEQLKNMEKRGLLERRRSADDRRKVHVHLTDEGRSLKENLLPFAPYVNRIALDGLTPGEIGFLRLAMTRVQQNLRALIAERGGLPRGTSTTRTEHRLRRSRARQPRVVGGGRSRATRCLQNTARTDWAKCDACEPNSVKERPQESGAISLQLHRLCAKRRRRRLRFPHFR